jgi:hypothetical protein
MMVPVVKPIVPVECMDDSGSSDGEGSIGRQTLISRVSIASLVS